MTRDDSNRSSTMGTQPADTRRNGDPTPDEHRPLPPDSKGRTSDDPDYAPFENPDSKLAHCNAEDERKKRWRRHRYALSVLDGRREPWARHIVTAAAYQNAEHDPEKAMPVLTFTGDKAVELGATDEQIAALHRLSPHEIAKLQIEAAALRAHNRAQVRQKAKSLASSRPPLTEVIRRIADMADAPPTAAIVDGLLYEEMVVSWVGAGSTFKTFTVLALACCVAAGRDFTHRLRVPEKRPVLVMCAESRRDGLFGDVRAWCEVHGVDIDTLDADGWKDVVQLGDDERMAELTAYVIEHGIKLVVIDTQRKATRGLEENSSTDMGAALANAAKLACEAKAAVVIIHHTGWGREHARGSSVTFDDTDATVQQERTDGAREAEFIITKHKSVATGTRFPVRLEQVTVDRPPAVFNGETAGPGTPIRTLVALSRDPLTTDERSEQVEANLADDDRILVRVVNDNDGQPLSSAEIHRRARERDDYARGEDFTREHLRRLADPASPVITGNHNPVTHRWTYSARTTAAAPSQDDRRGDGDNR